MNNRSVETINASNRESWLLAATELMRPTFLAKGSTIPPIKVSVGWPGGRGPKNKTIGQHWHPSASADNVSQIFISPILSDAIQALETLAHELVHAVYPDGGHGKEFKRLALAIGLEGKMTATKASNIMRDHLNALIDILGPYPHAALTPELSGIKKQGTRLLKCECSSCGYTVRVTKTWIEKGTPICPCNQESMTVEVSE